MHDFTTAMVGAAAADTVLAVVKSLEPMDAEARKAGADLETIEGGFGAMDGLKAANYLDGLAEKLSLTSSGSKANVLLAPIPWPDSPSEEQLFALYSSILRAETAALLRDTDVKTNMPLLNCISKNVNMKGSECVAALELQHYPFRLKSDRMRTATRRLEFMMADAKVTLVECLHVREEDKEAKLSLAQRVDLAIKKAASPLPSDESEIERVETEVEGSESDVERMETDAEGGESDTDGQDTGGNWQTMQLGVYGNQTTLSKVMRPGGSQQEHMMKWAEPSIEAVVRLPETDDIAWARPTGCKLVRGHPVYAMVYLAEASNGFEWSATEMAQGLLAAKIAKASHPGSKQGHGAGAGAGEDANVAGVRAACEAIAKGLGAARFANEVPSAKKWGGKEYDDMFAVVNRQAHQLSMRGIEMGSGKAGDIGFNMFDTGNECVLLTQFLSGCDQTAFDAKLPSLGQVLGELLRALNHEWRDTEVTPLQAARLLFLVWNRVTFTTYVAEQDTTRPSPMDGERSRTVIKPKKGLDGNEAQFKLMIALDHMQQLLLMVHPARFVSGVFESVRNRLTHYAQAAVGALDGVVAFSRASFDGLLPAFKLHLTNDSVRSQLTSLSRKLESFTFQLSDAAQAKVEHERTEDVLIKMDKQSAARIQAAEDRMRAMSKGGGGSPGPKQAGDQTAKKGGRKDQKNQRDQRLANQQAKQNAAAAAQGVAGGAPAQAGGGKGGGGKGKGGGGAKGGKGKGGGGAAAAPTANAYWITDEMEEACEKEFQTRNYNEALMAFLDEEKVRDPNKQDRRCFIKDRLSLACTSSRCTICP